jgi:hypothetical protein
LLGQEIITPISLFDVLLQAGISNKEKWLIDLKSFSSQFLHSEGDGHNNVHYDVQKDEPNHKTSFDDWLDRLSEASLAEPKEIQKDLRKTLSRVRQDPEESMNLKYESIEGPWCHSRLQWVTLRGPPPLSDSSAVPSESKEDYQEAKANMTEKK